MRSISSISANIQSSSIRDNGRASSCNLTQHPLANPIRYRRLYRNYRRVHEISLLPSIARDFLRENNRSSDRNFTRDISRRTLRSLFTAEAPAGYSGLNVYDVSNETYASAFRVKRRSRFGADRVEARDRRKRKAGRPRENGVVGRGRGGESVGESIKPVIIIYGRNIYGLSFRKLPRDYGSLHGCTRARARARDIESEAVRRRRERERKRPSNGYVLTFNDAAPLLA